MKTVWVFARPRKGAKDPDGAAGVWEVVLNDEREPAIAAGEALDTFHRKVAIEVLDDFDILVIDPDTGQEIFEAVDYQQGGDRGSVEFLGTSLKNVKPIPSRRERR